MTAKNTPGNFWVNVDIQGPQDCWLWQKSKNIHGYGRVGWQGKLVVAHRLAYYLTYGTIPLSTGTRKDSPTGKHFFVLHSCDTPACCNPAHLSIGDYARNQREAYERERRISPKSKHTNAKLTPGQVRKIRTEYAQEKTHQKVLAKRYKVSQRAISLVVRRKTYTDVI